MVPEDGMIAVSKTLCKQTKTGNSFTLFIGKLTVLKVCFVVKHVLCSPGDNFVLLSVLSSIIAKVRKQRFKDCYSGLCSAEF